MKPRELSAATVSDLRTSLSDMFTIAIAGREHESYLPDQLVVQMRHYHALRAERAGPTPEGAPVVSRLGSYIPLGSSAVWQLLKALPSPRGAAAVLMGSKRIRECFVVLGGDEAAASVAAIQRQADRRRIFLQSENGKLIPAQDVAEKVSQLLQDRIQRGRSRGHSASRIA